MDRVILHSDLNACYASIECMLDPSLKGKPVAVAGSVENRHGIILAKSQEAKICGVKTAEAIWQAQLKCPKLIIIPPHFNEYIKYSKDVRDIYRRYTDLIEPFGLDEAWLDVSGSTMLFGNGEKIANDIRRTVKYELGLTVSVGVSFNKVFAKMGSDLKKPDAVTVISRDEFKEKLWALPASDMIGVGRATSAKLAGFGVHTLGELAACDREWLIKIFGKGGNELWTFANGLDISRVKPDGFQTPVKSVGHGITCSSDLVDANEVWRVFLQLSQNVNRSLCDYKLLASGIQITIKDCNLFGRQFQKKLKIPTQSAIEMARAAIELFNENYTWNYDVRAVTIRAIDLISSKEPSQINLFVDTSTHEKQEKIDSAVLEIRRRFGKNIIFNACLMSEDKMPDSNPKESVMPSYMFR
jgi:DNA polymerase-4